MDGDARDDIRAGRPPSLGMGGWLRVVARFACLIALLLIFVPLHYCAVALRRPSPFPMLFLRYAGRVCGARLRRVGEPLRRDVFFIANHVSWLDIFLLAGASGTAFVAKDELRTTPLVGWLADLNNTLYVKRNDRANVAGQIDDLRRQLDGNWRVTIFPEGTTGDNRSLMPFKTSMLSVLDPPPPGVRVQPVLLDYGAVGEDIGWVGRETGLQNFKRVLARRGTFTVAAHFLEPFSPEDYRGRKAIGARARAVMDDALTRVRAIAVTQRTP